MKVGCTGKKPYASFIGADRAAKKLNRAQDAAHVAAYHCRYCASFHVGEARAHGRKDARRDVED